MAAVEVWHLVDVLANCLAPMLALADARDRNEGGAGRGNGVRIYRLGDAFARRLARKNKCKALLQLMRDPAACRWLAPGQT